MNDKGKMWVWVQTYPKSECLSNYLLYSEKDLMWNKVAKVLGNDETSNQFHHSKKVQNLNKIIPDLDLNWPALTCAVHTAICYVMYLKSDCIIYLITLSETVNSLQLSLLIWVGKDTPMIWRFFNVFKYYSYLAIKTTGRESKNSSKCKWRLITKLRRL